jgi:hypothetical protein
VRDLKVLLGRDAVSPGEYFPPFRTTVMPTKRRKLLAGRHSVTSPKTGIWSELTQSRGHEKVSVYVKHWVLHRKINDYLISSYFYGETARSGPGPPLLSKLHDYSYTHHAR